MDSENAELLDEHCYRPAGYWCCLCYGLRLGRPIELAACKDTSKLCENVHITLVALLQASHGFQSPRNILQR